MFLSDVQTVDILKNGNELQINLKPFIFTLSLLELVWL